MADLILPNKGSPGRVGAFTSRSQMVHADIGPVPYFNVPPLTIQQKYTDSYRINFPNYAEVCRITYAKGVIGDGGDGSAAFYWEYTPGVSFLMSSYVKVVGAWGVSDYIQLYYHPKPKYWDNVQGPATLCENGYFPWSFMSFRCGDEVKVLLQDGVPQAVVGFYDSIPRIGEAVFKMVDGDPFDIWGVFLGMGTLSGENGPDGINLGLTQKAVRLYGGYIYYGNGFVPDFACKFIIGPIMYVLASPYDSPGNWSMPYIFCSAGNYYQALWDSIESTDDINSAINTNKIFHILCSVLTHPEYFGYVVGHITDVYTRPHN